MRRRAGRLRYSSSPPDHRLAARAALDVEDLDGEELLLLEDVHCLRDQALEVCSRVVTRERQDFRATSLETLRQMVAAGGGITLLPALAVENPVHNTRLAVRPFRAPAPARSIGAVWRTSSPRAGHARHCRRRHRRSHAP